MKIDSSTPNRVENYLAPVQDQVLENDKNLQEYVNFIAASRLSLSYEKSVTAENLKLERDGLLKELGFSVELDVEAEFKFEGSASIQSIAERAIQAEFKTEFEFSFKFNLKISAEAELEKQDPIVLDLDGNGEFSFSSVSEGRVFDINADGRLDKTNFVTGLDAFLAIDLNKNGKIDDGKELFGDQNGAANGFEELLKYDDNGDNVIDEEDEVYSSLLAFGENFLTPISEVGVESFNLVGYYRREQAISDQVTLTERATAQTDFGEINIADAIVSFRRIA